MRHYSTNSIGLEYIQCDICGEKSYGDNGWNPGDENVVEEASIRYNKVEKDYGEGGGLKHIHWADICPSCFRWKLIPWLKRQGTKVEALVPLSQGVLTNEQGNEEQNE